MHETYLHRYPHLLIDFQFFLFIKFSSVFSIGHFSTHAIYKSHLHSTSYSLNPFLLLFLSLSPAYSPLCFYLSLFHTKRKLFEQSVSLNELISLNTVLHLRVSTQYYQVEYRSVVNLTPGYLHNNKMCCLNKVRFLSNLFTSR
jgi:hypothetical protein